MRRVSVSLFAAALLWAAGLCLLPAQTQAQVQGGTAPSSPVLPYTAPTHQFVNGINSAGQPQAVQPACADLSNAAATCSSADAAGLTGTVAAARLPAFTGDATSSAGSNVLSVGRINGTACDAGFTLGLGGCLWSQTTASSSALQWTGLVGSDYLLECSNLTTVSSAFILLQFGQGGGPTWKTSGYKYGTVAGSSGGGPTNSGSASAAGIALTFPTDNGSATGGTNIRGVSINQLSSATDYHGATGTSSLVSAGGYVLIGGVYPTDTTAITAVRAIPSTGNFADGGKCTLRQRQTS